MLTSNYKLQIHDVFDAPSKLLLREEREYICSIYPEYIIKPISIEASVCKRLGARPNDIICIRLNHTDIYRRVLDKYYDV